MKNIITDRISESLLGKGMFQLAFMSTLLLLFACEDVIDVELDPFEQNLVVDAWLTNQSSDQVVQLSRAQGYFDSSVPSGITNAEVYIDRQDGQRFHFEHSGQGNYVWSPESDQDRLGAVDDSFVLHIDSDEGTFRGEATIFRVPQIDSIGQEFRDDEIFLDDGIYLQFYARDFVGLGDAYWIKAFRNGTYLDKIEELNLAYDAGFDAGTGIDGLIFIPPIRELVNPVDEDLIPQPWDPGDHIRVEIHSMSTDAFNFMEIARDQIANGNNGIFGLPLANTNGNISRNDDGTMALGFFNIAAVSSLEKTVD